MSTELIHLLQVDVRSQYCAVSILHGTFIGQYCCMRVREGEML
jgi:hypothetical protein